MIISPGKVPDLEHDPDLEQLFQIRVRMQVLVLGGRYLRSGETFSVVFLKYKIFAKNLL